MSEYTNELSTQSHSTDQTDQISAQSDIQIVGLSESQQKISQSDSQPIDDTSDQSHIVMPNDLLTDQSTAENQSANTTEQSAQPSPVDEPSIPIPPPVKQTLQELIASIDLNWCPFSLQTRGHNIILALRTPPINQSITQSLRPWIRCQRSSCGKWRGLPRYLNQLSPSLPETKLTLSSLFAIDLPSYLPHPFHCSAGVWDLDRTVCSAVQDYTDLAYDWNGLPLKFVRHPVRFDFYVALADFLRRKGVQIREYPYVYSKPVDLFALYTAVYQLGGDAYVTQHQLWPAIYKLLKMSDTQREPMDVAYVAEIYRTFFFEWQSTPLDFQSIDTSATPRSAVVARLDRPSKAATQAQTDVSRQPPPQAMNSSSAKVDESVETKEEDTVMDMDT